jgi:DNA topoisomerase I
MPDSRQIKISANELRKLATDNIGTAEAISLRYVSDREPGISRIKTKSGFKYQLDNEPVIDEATLSRIKSLVIPPAWTNVWICRDAEGHLQATGLDTKQRKQYRYHNLWNALRSQAKFSHLYDFGDALPLIRKQVKKDLSLPGMPMNKVLATIVALMQYTSIRIGNSSYEKLYGSFGLTTMEEQHVQIDGSKLKFMFKGKKGVYHDIELQSRHLARIVQQSKEIPGKELFQYYDEDGSIKTVDSGMVNDYIKGICNRHFTSKDFRTWAGSVYALEAFNKMGRCNTKTETKSKIAAALDMVAKRLGNTRDVCRKYYIHPAVITHYLNNNITKYFNKIKQLASNGVDSLGECEIVLMKILKDFKSVVIEAN